MLAALDGEVRVAGPRGRRTIRWDDFFQTYFTTSLDAMEICEEIVIPTLSPAAGTAFEELTHRHGDFAIVGVAAVLEADASRRCTMARLAVAGAGPTPMRPRRAEQCLVGQALSPALFDEAARLVSEEVEPESDLHASAAFRRHLARTMTVRALRRAADRLNSRGRT
jgi:CO/xanthine dehydrogenase FAD-binding subunit